MGDCNNKEGNVVEPFLINFIKLYKNALNTSVYLKPSDHLCLILFKLKFHVFIQNNLLLSFYVRMN